MMQVVSKTRPQSPKLEYRLPSLKNTTMTSSEDRNVRKLRNKTTRKREENNEDSSIRLLYLFASSSLPEFGPRPSTRRKKTSFQRSKTCLLDSFRAQK